MEQNRNTVGDFSVSVFSVSSFQPNSSEVPVPDDDKAGAAFLFSGVFLGVIGITFTVMGWVKSEGVIHLIWTQFLGPVLLSVSVTFVLIAVCKFKVFSCMCCSQSGERTPDTEWTPNGLYPGIRQPITFYRAAMVQGEPPSTTQDRLVATNSPGFHQLFSFSGIPPFSASVNPVLSPPPYNDNVNPLNNSAFSVEISSIYQTVDTISERSSNSLEEQEELLNEALCDDFLPPAYEQLFPPSS